MLINVCPEPMPSLASCFVVVATSPKCSLLISRPSAVPPLWIVMMVFLVDVSQWLMLDLIFQGFSALLPQGRGSSGPTGVYMKSRAPAISMLLLTSLELLPPSKRGYSVVSVCGHVWGPGGDPGFGPRPYRPG